MSFTTKQNPWKVKDEKIKSLEAEIIRLKQEPMLRMFAEQLGRNILVQLAQKKYEDWPQLAKGAFAWTAHMYPVPAHFYKEALPK